MKDLVRYLVVLILLLLATPIFGQGKSPNGPPGPVGNPGNRNGNGNGNPEPPSANNPPPNVSTPEQPIGGQRITLFPGVDPKSLVPISANNVSNVLSQPTSVSLSELSIIRSILLNNIGYGAREVGAWAASHGDFVKEESTSKVSTAGIIAAFDRRICDWLVLGVVGGYNHSGSDTIDFNGGWGGAYAILYRGNFYLNQTVIGGGESFRTTRNGLLGTAHANSAGWLFSEVTQAGYNKYIGNLTIGPYGLLQYSLTGNPTFSESGSDAPVTVHAATNESIVSDVGLDASYKYRKLTFKTSVAWEHEFADSTSFTKVNIVGIPSSTTTVAGTSLGHDSALINVGLSYGLTKTISLSVGYTGQFARKNYESSSISAAVKIHF